MPNQFEYAARREITDRQARRHFAEIRRAFPRADGEPESAVECAARVTQHVALAMAEGDTAPRTVSQPALAL
jgi:hypothetical protein